MNGLSDRGGAARALVVVLVFWLVPPALATERAREIVILHTSDVHGGYASRPARWHEPDPTRRIGGFAVLANLARAESRPRILLDSGDLFQGTPEGNLTLGEASITLMNQLGYAAMAIGNHEYDFGEPNLRKLARLANFPMFGANIFRKRDGVRVEYAEARRVFHVGGVAVGVLGVATRHTRTSTLPKNVEHLDFGPEAAQSRHEADQLRREGATVVVALTHCGLAPSVARQRINAGSLKLTQDDRRYGGDLDIARAGGVDVVLGGHMHTGLSRAWVDPESEVPIVQSYQNLEAVSRVVIGVDEQGAPQSIAAELVDLWVDQYGEDPEVLAILERYRTQVGETLDQVIGRLDVDMKRGKEDHDWPLGNWLTDLMRAAARTDLAVQNTRGIRADLHAGPLTTRDIYQVMPFDNTLVTTTLTGAQLRTLVRGSLRGGVVRLHFSGLTVSATVAPDGVIKKMRIRVNGKPLSSNARYTVATNNYLAAGGSGGKVFLTVETHDTGRNIRDLFIDAVRAPAQIEPPPSGRITFNRP